MKVDWLLILYIIVATALMLSLIFGFENIKEYFSVVVISIGLICSVIVWQRYFKKYNF